MGLVSPDYGTIFWMVLAFGIVFFILAKFAWKPILKGLKDREESIDEALRSAELARAEMARLEASNEAILLEARAERDALLGEARKIREELIGKARDEAAREAEKVVEKAHQQIENEKQAAIADIRRQISDLSVLIAEKIIRQKLKEDTGQEKLIADMLKDLKLN